jgi:CheY-like chemotaxis protein
VNRQAPASGRRTAFNPPPLARAGLRGVQATRRSAATFLIGMAFSEPAAVLPVSSLKRASQLLQLLGGNPDQQTFDVVISDMGMGAGMNGWELAEAVGHRWPEVRFLLATGWGAAIDPGEARAKGVEAVLTKPYHPADLLRALARTEVAA